MKSSGSVWRLRVLLPGHAAHTAAGISPLFAIASSPPPPTHRAPTQAQLDVAADLVQCMDLGAGRLCVGCLELRAVCWAGGEGRSPVTLPLSLSCLLC